MLTLIKDARKYIKRKIKQQWSDKGSTDSFQRYSRSKNPGMLLDQRHTGHTQPKVVVLDCYLLLISVSMQKIRDNNWFLLIKEFCNLIGWEAQLATLNQKQQSQMLPYFDHLTPSREIDD